MQDSINAIPSIRYEGLNAWVLLALLITACLSINPASAQRPSLNEGVLALPYVVSNETAYSAELSLIPDSDPIRFELIASQPLALRDSLDSGSFADNKLFVTDIDVNGLAYWLELLLIDHEVSTATVFEVLDFGVHAAVISSNLLGLDTQPQWQRLPGNASDIGVSADGSGWAIGTDERGGGFGIYQWLGTTWQRVAGGALRIDVDPNGIPWIVNDSHSI